MDIRDINVKNQIIQKYVSQPLWGNWYFKEILGAGSTGIVYRAEAQRISRVDTAAVKAEIVLPRENCITAKDKSDSIKERLLTQSNESEIMSKLRKCPYIVSYEDEDVIKFPNDKQPDGCIFLLRMELLQNLSDIITKNKIRLCDEVVAKVGIDIANAVKAIHRIGYMHRDIKPGNIFYSKNEDLYKLGDFDISKNSNMGMTQVGTPLFVAPEIVVKGALSSYNNTVDIYSLGMTLYMMLNDMQEPFYKELKNESEAYTRRLLGAPLPPPVRASKAFSNIILKACAYDPNNRYRTIEEFISALESLNGTRQTNLPNNRSAAAPNKPVEPLVYQARYQQITPPVNQAANRKVNNPIYEPVKKPPVPAYPPQNGTGDDWYEQGMKYYYGNGVEQDYDIAFRLFSQANAKGSLKGKNALAVCYETGHGIKQDLKAAITLYTIAAQGGLAYAQQNLGRCYFKGKGVPKDYEKAVYWYKKAAKQGNENAQKALLKPELAPYIKGREQQKYQSQPESPQYCFEQGEKYYYGRGVTQSYSEGNNWFRKAARMGHAKAQYKLGLSYFYGNGTAADQFKAVEWIKKAAEQGDEEAQLKYGNCLSNGNGVNKDESEAVSWYRKAAEQGYSAGQYVLANCYYYGKGINKNYREAVKWYKKAAEQGHKNAAAALQRADLDSYL